jgi:hypothetical protein
LKREVTPLQDDVAELSDDVAAMRTDLSLLQQEVESNHRELLRELRNLRDSITARTHGADGSAQIAPRR